MKKLLTFITLLWAVSLPLAAQNTPPNITLEAAFLEMAYNGNLEAVQEFVSKGTPVDSTIDDKSTALMWASFNGHTPVVVYLLEQGAIVDLKDINGRCRLDTTLCRSRWGIGGASLEQARFIGRALLRKVTG